MCLDQEKSNYVRERNSLYNDSHYCISTNCSSSSISESVCPISIFSSVMVSIPCPLSRKFVTWSGNIKIVRLKLSFVYVTLSIGSIKLY